MTTKFDWSQFEEELPQTKSFDWSQFEEETPSFFERAKSGLRSKESRIPAMKQEIARAGKVIGSTVAGLPGDIQEIARSAPQSLMEKITGKQFPDQFTKATRALSPFGDLPTQKELTKSAEEAIPSLKPQTQEEKDWEDNLSLITSLALPVPGGKAKAISKAHQSALYQAGRRLGMSEKELAPLAHGKITEKVLAHLSKGSKRARESLHATQEGLGHAYDLLKVQGSRSTLSPSNLNTIEKSLLNFRKELEKTIGMSADTKGIISYIDDSLARLRSQPRTAEDLINWYQNINGAVNWNAVKGGKKRLGVLKDSITRAIRREDPVLAENFGHINELYKKSASILDHIGEEGFLKLIRKEKGLGTLAAMVGLAFAPFAKQAGLAYLASKPLAIRLLTNPSWANLKGKALTALKNKSPKAAQAILQAIRQKAKEDMSEEEFNQIEWD